jgi:hypothetical protein
MIVKVCSLMWIKISGGALVFVCAARTSVTQPFLFLGVVYEVNKGTLKVMTSCPSVCDLHPRLN